MNIVFIRHSKSLVNPNISINTWGLSEEGVTLAKKLNSLSQIKSIEVIYTSLQPKALETAILVTKNLGIQIKTDDRLTESSSFTNKFVDIEKLQENAKEYHSNRNISINGGETSAQSVSRFTDAINDIVVDEKDKQNIGIVSHGGILADFASQYLKEDAYTLVEKMSQPDVAILNWETKQFSVFFGELV